MSVRVQSDPIWMNEETIMFTIRFDFSNGKIGHMQTVSLEDARNKIAFFKRINPCIVNTYIFDTNFDKVLT